MVKDRQYGWLCFLHFSMSSKSLNVVKVAVSHVLCHMYQWAMGCLGHMSHGYAKVKVAFGDVTSFFSCK